MTQSPTTQPRLIHKLIWITLARLLINIGLRMVYPFAPALARGLGVPIADVYRLITLRNLAGFFSPLFSPLSERYGRQPTMIGAMVVFSLSCLLVVIWPTYLTLGVTLALIALTKVIFDPAMQSYVAENVAYERRGKAISFTELSWAGALLIGGPAISLAMARQGWQAPFFWLGLLGVAAAVALWRFVPRVSKQSGNGAVNLRQTAQVIWQYRVIWAAMIYIALAMGANETLLIVFGDWMESSFGLPLVALGFSAGLIGLAEVTGELTAGWSVDKFGKRPIIISAGILTALTSLIVPLTSHNLTMALIVYFGMFLFFEITVVGGVPLLTEIVPGNRAVVMSSVLAASALGRTLGSWLGPHLFITFGYVGNGVAAAVMMGAAVFVLTLWVQEGAATEGTEENL
ncbi:MAG: MFS transporter [Chloroflexi bacterium]|nr:MFS transporter [Chloroflexota bacterium]